MRAPLRGALAAMTLVLVASNAGLLSCRRVRAPSVSLDGGTVLGEQRRWALTFEARMTGGTARGAPPVSMSMTGDWIETVVGASEGGYDVACELANPRATGGGVEGVKPEEVAALERRMAHRFFVSYRADGAALQIHFPRDVDPGARNLLQIIVTDTQIVRPAQPAPQWTAIERDGGGSYLAAYRREGAAQIVKTKLKYVAGAPGAPPGVEMVVDASERRLTVDAHDALVAFDGGDTVRLALPMGGAAISMRVSTRLTDLVRTEAPELGGALERARATLDSSGIVTHAPSADEAQAKRDADLTAGVELTAVVRAVAAGGAADEPREQLEAWVRLHAEACPIVIAAVHTATPGLATKALTAVLGRAGTAPAQGALLGLASDATLSAATRTDALVGLMLLQKPTSETMRAMLSQMGVADPVVRKAAYFAAGTLAHAARARSPADAEALDAAISARYDGAGDAATRAELLGPIGNSAGPSLLPRIRAALSDRDLDVRAGGARALRLYDDDGARDLLAAAIADREPTVRAAAIFAAGFAFDSRYVDPLTKAALTDVAAFVRKDAVSLLGAHQDAAVSIADTLERVAKTDAKPDVRKAARTAQENAAR